MRQQKESLKHKFAWTSIVMNFGKLCVLLPEAHSNTTPLHSVVYELQKEIYPCSLGWGF